VQLQTNKGTEDTKTGSSAAPLRSLSEVLDSIGSLKIAGTCVVKLTSLHCAHGCFDKCISLQFGVENSY